MPHTTCFVQGCPTCGRRLQIRVEYLGKRVICQHCRGEFLACDHACQRCEDGHAAEALVRRANELLKRAAEQVERGRQWRLE
jgi:hypothetical protein